MLSIMLLALVLQHVNGNQTIVHVSELISDDEDFITNGEDDNSHICCVYGNCTCNSLDHALANLTSNVLINITTDIMLSSLIKVSGFYNVSIIGHNNTTVNCKHVGGMHFTFCHNCIIQGITWDGCGTEITDNLTEPGIKLNYSSNVTIHNCCFQHSIGQAVVLSEVSGDVNINICNFVNNSHYRGHGAAIHYSYMYNTKKSSHDQFVFTINNCNFTNNRNIKSLVYIRNGLLKYHRIFINNSIFSSNNGISVYVINHEIYINGKVLFQNNIAEDSTGIYISDHSTVLFGENSNVTFSQNLAHGRGAAVFLKNHSICLFNQNSIVTFNYNKATKGGAIYSEDNSNVTFKETYKITFNSNSATQEGGAIYSVDKSYITFVGNTGTTTHNNIMHYKTLQSMTNEIKYSIDNFHMCFEENHDAVLCNSTGNYDGAIYCEKNFQKSFEKASTTVFSNNNAYNSGGAIWSDDNSYISFEGNSATVFSNNTAYYGGAITSNYNCNISFLVNSTTVFSNNAAPYNGGAIRSYNSYISFEGNSATVFSDNIAHCRGAITSNYNCSVIVNGISILSINAALYSGGAIHSYNSYISFEVNSFAVFINNTAVYGGAISSYVNSYISFEGSSVAIFTNSDITLVGGAIHSYNSYISFKENCATVFSNNTGSLAGSAINSFVNSSVSFEGNSVTVFANNNSSAIQGGAITSSYSSYISFKENSTTTFSNNGANFDGGAISSYHSSSINFEGNSVTRFSANTANYGGAIHSSSNSHILLQGNSAALFCNNNANYKGGAVHLCINSSISFKGNSATIFSGNSAGYDGGAIASSDNSYTSFEENSATEFSNNTANYGHAIHSILNSHIFFEGNSAIVFSNTNKCSRALHSDYKSNRICKKNSSREFTYNEVNYSRNILSKNNNLTISAKILCLHNSTIKVKGHSSIIFKDCIVKWCANVCLPYPGEADAVVIDDNGIVWCSNQKAFNCLSHQCYNNCKNLKQKLNNVKNNKVANITENVVVLSSVIELNSSDVLITGHNNPKVICVNDSGLKFYNSNNLTIEGITWIECGALRRNYLGDIPVLAITGCSNVIIQKCSFLYSVGPVIKLTSVSGYVNITNCIFMNSNHYKGYGTSIALLHIALSVRLEAFTVSNCNFDSNKGAMSVLYVAFIFAMEHSNTYLINCSFHSNEGATIYISSVINFYLHIIGEILFQNNIAEDGAGIYIADSSVIFDENSDTKFINNTAHRNGAAIFLYSSSCVIFDSNSKVTFTNNKASTGTIYSEHKSCVTFKATCNVTFNRNSAIQYGAAIYSFDHSQVIFTGNATVTFKNNYVPFNDAQLQHGGTVLSKNNSKINFEDNTVIVFSNNSADFGSAIFSIHSSDVVFKDSSRVMFDNNMAHYCGVLTSAILSIIIFTDTTNVTYDANTVSYILLNSNDVFSGGTICTLQRSKIMFTQNSLVIFINNRADKGAAVLVFKSNVIMKEYSTLIFNNNFGLYSSGGAFVCSNNSNVTIKGNSNVTFNNNKASQSGGAIHSYNMCRITFKENSKSYFINNIARDEGGTIFGSENSEITFEGSSTVMFDCNTADNGGVFYFTNSTVLTKESSLLLFYNNNARQSGGVGYFTCYSEIRFEGNSTVRFDNNIAKQNAGVLYVVMSSIIFTNNSTVTVTDNKATFNGGALYFNNSNASFTEYTKITFHHNRAIFGGVILADDHSNITLIGNSMLLFVSNEATQSGGAAYFNYSSNFIIKGNAMVKFDYNKALEGGAVYINCKAKFRIKENSTVFFYNNVGTVNGGAVKLLNDSIITLKDHINIKFINNNAHYGGAIFLDTTAVMVNSSYKNCINFTNNIAQVLGNSIYQEAATSCNSSCLSDRLVNISSEFVATPPNELKFYDPAICIDDDNNTQCHSYYVQNIMLGTNIVIPACVLDYYNQSIDSIHFLIQSEINPNYFFNGPKQTLISCSTFEGISIMGNQSLSQSVNFSINITMNIALNSNWKQISVNLIVELSPCHLGFWQYPKSRRCECYSASDIVFCSGSSSTIKRGYWFGSVSGKPTVTFCPINYCNFTCCETSNGYYHLSPVRENQCRSHRSDTACGSCEEGYTLSFDSVECVHMNECGIGWTILVLALVVLYWIVIIVAVFSLMHFKVAIGYLCAITYYYSVMDLLLNQNWYQSGALYTTINVMSSVANIIPQFLGRFCFIPIISGIDQQFIHYIHPVALSLFLIMIAMLARRSQRLSYFIGRGIIRVICSLLLLSYTSLPLATTSLLLMRPLVFHDINKVYTYVSPNIQYFHGRHLVYGIVALLFTTVIVIGLPLLLALEPFLNSKKTSSKLNHYWINFKVAIRTSIVALQLIT